MAFVWYSLRDSQFPGVLHKPCSKCWLVVMLTANEVWFGLQLECILLVLITTAFLRSIGGLTGLV